MTQLSNILKVAKEYKERYIITDQSSEAERLRFELMKRNLSKSECLELQKKVSLFLKSDASEEDKEIVKGYTESLGMICSAIKSNLL